MSDNEEIVEVPQEAPKKWKNKKGVDEKRKKALENLAKGRAKRLEMIKAQKSKREYKLNSSDSETDSSDSDEELLKTVLSKKKKVKHASKPDDRIDRLERSVLDLATTMKKGMKKIKRNTSNKSEKIVLLPPQQQSGGKTDKSTKSRADLMLEHFKSGLF